MVHLRQASARALSGVVVAGLLALGSTVGARAAVVTETAPVSGVPIDFSDLGVDAYILPFDPTLGTLTAVGLHLTGTLTPGLEAFDVPSPLPAVFTTLVTLTPAVSIASPGGVTQTLPAETLSFAQGDTPGRQVLAGTPEAVDLSETVAPGALESFPGRGVDIYVTGRSGPAFGVPSPGFFGTYDAEDLAALTGQLLVTYTYTPVSTQDDPPADPPGSGAGTPVPEPASLGLLLVGLAGLGLVRRLPA